MRWFVVSWLLSGCAMVTRTAFVVDPILIAPTSRPIPAGQIAADPARVEVKACGVEYQGLANLIARAQAERDGLIEVTVDVEHQYIYRGYGVGSEIRGTPVLVDEQRCYVLRAYKVTFRDE